MNKKLRVCVLIQAAVLSLLCINSAAVPYGDNNIEPKVIKAVEIPSDGGMNDIKYVDESGNEVNFELVPDIQMANCSLPYYNLYDDERATVVKNQGKEGICWAFAGMSAVESNLITQELEMPDVDLSEKYMAWFTNGAGPSDTSDPLYGDVKQEIGTSAYSTGGNLYDVTYLLARGSGPVYDSVVPQNTNTALSEDLRYASLYGLNNMQIFSPTDITSIKNAIYNNGAVFLSYYSNNTYLNNTTYGYYCSSSFSTNHGVSVVGWDDNFSKDNFKTAAPDDGAWIVKNSWGENWGDNGFFYLSYYDSTIKTIGSIVMEDKLEYDKIYQYDGNIETSIYFNDYGISGANIFTAESDEILKSVGFWTRSAEMPYNLKVYIDIPEGGTPSDGTLVHTQSGNEPYAGYHKVDLTSALGLDAGCKYAVVIELKATGAALQLDGYASGTGVSFYSTYSSNYYWHDSAQSYSSNVCIKAFTEIKDPSINQCIKVINNINSKDYIVKLTDKQLAAIERVLEYDRN